MPVNLMPEVRLGQWPVDLDRLAAAAVRRRNRTRHPGEFRKWGRACWICGASADCRHREPELIEWWIITLPKGTCLWR